MNGNGDVHEVEVFDDETELRGQAIALVEQALSAIGGLKTEDADEAGETVARLYLRMLRAVREEE